MTSECNAAVTVGTLVSHEWPFTVQIQANCWELAVLPFGATSCRLCTASRGGCVGSPRGWNIPPGVALQRRHGLTLLLACTLEPLPHAPCPCPSFLPLLMLLLSFSPLSQRGVCRAIVSFQPCTSELGVLKPGAPAPAASTACCCSSAAYRAPPRTRTTTHARLTTVARPFIPQATASNAMGRRMQQLGK